MNDSVNETTPLEQHLRRMIWPYDGEKDKEAIRWSLNEIERLRTALIAVMEADKVHGSARGLLVGPSYEIARRALEVEP